MHTLGARLREERARLGLTQPAFATACGAKKTSQINYEADRRRPDSAYLTAASALGVDVLYVLTGNRSAAAHVRPHELRDDMPPALVLTAQEAALVDNYRNAGDQGRRALEVASAALAQSGAPLKDTGS